jgi:opacity protein-like surface antigen
VHGNEDAEEEALMKTNLLLAAIAWTVVATPAAWGQRGIELTPFVGGQFNGGLDLSTTLYKNIDMQNGLNYGFSAGYLLGKHGGVEFTWSRNHADTTVQSTIDGSSVKVLSLKTNEYLGYYVLHFNDSEKRLRPFVLFGAGVTNIGTDRSGVGSITRFTWAFGGGVKYGLGKHLALRLQGKWSPVYINTITDGVWCDPFWAGCWSKGDTLFLQQLDGTAGLTFRF